MILVTGAAGQLGTDVVLELRRCEIKHLAVDIAELDITDRNAVVEFLILHKPSCVIHCAAYTAVDAAEDEPELCMRVNAKGTENLALACREIDAEMIYISTDYVFSGEGDAPYEANTPKKPQSVYGKSKLAGEEAVIQYLDKYYIVRTSWMFGKDGANFVKTMISLAQKRDEINVANDQIGSPTYTPDLAALLYDIALSGKYGVYHATNEGFCSWAEFAEEIMRLNGYSCRINHIPSEQYSARAVRPKNSRMSKEDLDKAGFKRLPSWQNALSRYLKIENTEDQGLYYNQLAYYKELTSRLKNENKRLQAQIEIQHQTFINTISWRITKPLRAVKKLAGGFLKNRTFIETDPAVAPYNQWIAENEPSEGELKKQKDYSFPYNPVLSLILPYINVQLDSLKELISSLKAQTYENWELIIHDTRSLNNSEVYDLYRSDKRIKNRLINEDDITGDYVGFLSHNDILAPFALFEIANSINEFKEIDFLYADEDKVNKNGRFEPLFKPGFAPDTLCSTNYIGSFFIIKKIFVNTLTKYEDIIEDKYFELILRVIEVAKNICHIPKILCHKYCNDSQNTINKSSTVIDDSKAIQDHITRRLGYNCTVTLSSIRGIYNIVYDLVGTPKVSILIPNKDHIELLKPCIESIIKLTTYKNYEVVIIENNSENVETFSYYRNLETQPQIRVIYYPETKFNYQKIINYGVRNCTTEYILQLNNDTQVLTPNWLELMLGLAQRPDVGAVGAKLYYPDMSIQHVGGVFTSDELLTEHIFIGMPKRKHGFMNREHLIQNISWVTGACTLSRKTVYEQIGFMDDEYEIFYGDVDFCMKVKATGMIVLFHPFVEFLHYEAKTRGNHNTPNQYAIYQLDKERFCQKWQKEIMQGDPFYNPNIKKVWNYNDGYKV